MDRLGAEVVDIEMPEGASGLRKHGLQSAPQKRQRHIREPSHRARPSTARTFAIFLALARPSPATSMRRPVMCVELQQSVS